MKNSFKRVLTVALSAAMVLTAAPLASVNAEAATKVVLSAKKGTVQVGKSKKVTIKNTKKANITKVSFKYSKKNIAKAVWKKATANKITVKGKKAGKTVITATIKLKNKVAGKKTYKLKYTATVKKAETTPVTYVDTEAINLDKTEASIEEGQTVTLSATTLPAEGVAPVTWTSSDETVATVSAGVVTGVKVGEATITATSGDKSVTAKITVTAKTITAHLTDAKQTKSDEIQVTFDVDATKATTPVTKDDIKVDALKADGTVALTIPVNKLTFAEGGLTATATLAQAMTDKTEYKVTVGESSSQFTASVGKVASIQILTASVENGKPTPIEFTLLDAAGIDVKGTVKVDTTVSINIDGQYTSADTSKASKATITMGEVGAEATITVTYNSGESGADPIEQKQVVKCIDANATVGKGIYAQTDDLITFSDDKQCAKFFAGASSTNTTVEVENDAEDIYFYAKDDKDDSAIDYETYEVESSNPDVVGAAISDGYTGGKYTRIKITGNKVGTANLNVKASKYGKETYYTIPVTVTKQGELQNITVTLSKTTMTNAVDNDYSGRVTVKAVDTNGNTITGDCDIAYDEADPDKAGTNKIATGLVPGGDVNGFVVTGNRYTARGAMGGSYAIKVDVSKDGKVISRNVTVSVQDLGSSVWTASGADIKYEIEVTSNSIDLVGDNTSTTVALVAKFGGKFAGYVRNDVGGSDAYIGSVSDSSSTGNGYVHVKAASRLGRTIGYAVKYGSQYTNTLLAKTATGSAINKLDTAWTYSASDGNIGVTFTTNAGAGSTYYVGKESENFAVRNFARAGQYTIYFATQSYNTKTPGFENATPISNTFKVNNNVVAPKVTVTSRAIDSLSESDALATMVTNIDLNNNLGLNNSIIDTMSLDDTNTAALWTYNNGSFTPAVESNNKFYVGFAVVRTYAYTGTGTPAPALNFVVPVNSSFTAN